MNNLPLAAGLADARRVDSLKVIQSQTSVTKQERRRAYRRKRSARLKSPPFKCAPPAVEPNILIHTPLLSLIVNLISLITSSLLLL